jgi:hypothetical protein
MLQSYFLLLLLHGGGSNLNAGKLFYASEATLSQVVGPRTSPKREPGIRFAHPGYYEVWVNADGKGMSHIRLGLKSLITWKAYLAQLGLSAAHASTTPIPVAQTLIPLFRDRLAIDGVKGLPDNSWKVTYVEYAVANVRRLKANKAAIFAAGVGPARNRLIETCYDWWSEIDLSR